MPEAALYLKSALAAAGASIVCILALGGWRSSASRTRTNSVCVLAVGLGLALGYAILRLRPAWPPTNALGRFLTVVLPTVLLIELIDGLERVPGWFGWLLRLALALSVVPILLHGSVYLAGTTGQWTATEAGLVLAGGGSLLTIEWVLLSWLSRRAPAALLPLALSQSSLCAGIAVMLAGYIGGGSAALPLAAALAGASAALLAIKIQPAPQGMAGIGVVGLFSLLVIGRYFGRLSSGAALAIFLAPLLCSASETQLLRKAKPWLKAVACLALAAAPLALVLLAAKAKFDQEMAPLLR